MIQDCVEGGQEGKKIKISESEAKIEACTIALFDGDTLDRFAQKLISAAFHPTVQD